MRNRAKLAVFTVIIFVIAAVPTAIAFAGWSFCRLC